MYDLYYVLDASAFINGFELQNPNNFTVSEITEEVKDLKSRLVLNQAIEEERIIIREPEILALDLVDSGYNVKVMTDDYSMQNVLKIIGIPYGSIITEGIKGVYNWTKTCEGCKKDYPADYPFDDCEICGSKIFK